MKSGQTLKDDQIRAIVALVSGSVKNLPKENIQIVDDQMKLLTDGLFDKDKINLTDATDKQKQMKSDYEKNLENKVMEQLGKPFKNKVTVKVNVDLDFDAVQSKTTMVDPKGTPVSEKTVKDNTPNSSTNQAQSPIDNNMSNTTPTQNSTSGNSTHEEVTTNYEVGKSETTTIKAPGSVKRITASVIIDGDIDENLKTQVKSLVSNAIGFDEKRGDTISVEGLNIDNTDAQNAQKALDEMKQLQQKENSMKMYKEIAAGAGALIALIILIIALRKSKKKSVQEEQLEAITTPKGIDVLIGDAEQKSHIDFKPIDFESESLSERRHIEKEIKRYAAEKPEQVADIIKSWLAEDER
jgi:flagellar M-ring protein FliF